MFIEAPVYQEDLTSRPEIMQPTYFAKIFDNGDVPVDPGAVATPSVQIGFNDGTFKTVLLSYETIKIRLTALTGVVNVLGEIT